MLLNLRGRSMRIQWVCVLLLAVLIATTAFGAKVDLEMDVSGHLDLTGFGTDLYPGAELSHFAVHADDSQSAWTLIFTSTDPIDTVIEFYRYRLSKPLEENTGVAERMARWETGLPGGKGTLTVEVSRDLWKGTTQIKMIRAENSKEVD
jgi:hypothetical protein